MQSQTEKHDLLTFSSKILNRITSRPTAVAVEVAAVVVTVIAKINLFAAGSKYSLVE